MRHAWLILLLILFAGRVLADEVVVQVVSRTQASVNEAAELEGISATFSTTASSGGITQLTAGNSLTLTVSGMPRGTLKTIRLSVHSNSRGGAGEMQLLLGEQTIWSIGPTTFNYWHSAGIYSTAPVSIEKSGEWIMGRQDIILRISATANSLYLDGLTLVYEKAVPIAHEVVLRWWDDRQQIHYDTLRESAPQTGVVLPWKDTLGLTDSVGILWSHMGWMTEPIPQMTTEPNYKACGQRFYPDEDCMLYALYSDAVETVTEQNTTYDSGEYILIQLFQRQFYMANGPIGSDGYVPVKTCAVDTTGNLATWHANSLPALPRYWMERRGDSVQIRHITSDTYIGYDKGRNFNQLANKPSWWHIRRMDDNTLSFSHDYNALNNTERQLRMFIERDEEEHNFYCLEDHSPIISATNYSALYLFEVSALPTRQPAVHYTCQPNGLDDLADPTAGSASLRRIEFIHGVCTLVVGDKRYTLLGQRL